MRLNVQLDDDLYAMARAHALVNQISISRAICDLLRRRVEAPGPPVSAGTDPLTGLPVVVCRGGPITSDAVRAIDDSVQPTRLAGDC